VPGYPVRLLLAATSLAPVLFTYAAMILLDKALLAVLLVAAALALAVAGEIVLKLYRYKLELQPAFRIKAVKPVDQNVFAFIVAYLLPLVFESVVNLNIIGVTAIFGVLFLAIYRSNAFSFNPLLVLLFGYHFYEVTTEHDFTYVLVSKREIKNTEAPIEGVRISHYMFLDLKD
jgi:MFS family permease